MHAKQSELDVRTLSQPRWLTTLRTASGTGLRITVEH